MLRGLDGAIDVIVPRGGKSLVQRVQDEARVPVFAHLEGICHTYVDQAANIDIARADRRQRQDAAHRRLRRDRVPARSTRTRTSDFLTPLVKALLDAGCEVRGDAATQKADPRVEAGAPDDYGKEFLEPIIAVKIVDGVDEAIDHIARYGSQHTDAIITEDEATAERFLDRVDSAIVLRQRLDAVRRRRRIRLRRRDRHRDRQDARPRPRRRRAADELQVQGARQRPDPAEVMNCG